MPTDLFACPRCDKTPLAEHEGRYSCSACKIDFPALDGIPWLFADPQAALGEWRGRMQFALTKLSQDAAAIDAELRAEDLAALTRRRLERHRKALEDHRRRLAAILEPLDVQSLTGSHESYLALRTRLPADQGLSTYYANVHRDWAWGKEENEASLAQLRAVLHENAAPGDVLVLGAGAGRLAYDLHMEFGCARTLALDFNPLLVLIAKTVTGGGRLKLFEFPIAPRSLEDDVVLRKLEAPAPVRAGFDLVLGDALRPPFAPGSFDTVVTPWLIDIVNEDLKRFARRVNRLLKPDGRWVNFGSLAFAGPAAATRYSPEEVKAIVAEAGFSDPYVAEATIPYMCSPASRHGRRERVFTFAAWRERDADAPPRHRALPDWIVTGDEPVPLTPAFRTQAMTTQIYAFIMSLIDGKRTLKDMAVVLEKQKLMPRAEAEPAIRSFLTKMYDDAERSSGY
ncbi:MAG: methyltransferase domain-containing protein [Woeseiaceae bacterium]|nr:methyltransferase domain-containing protein [Woeseiaceae bacterium]